MERKLSAELPPIISKILDPGAAPISALLGFDACIDTIVRVVRERAGKEETGYFENGLEFGHYLAEKTDKSCGIELQTRLSKPGGNMTITGNALGCLDVKCECIGTFGYPDILPFFRALSPNCRLHTIADTITATALEFSNNKVIMFDPGPYNNLRWTDIKERVGISLLRELFSNRQIIALLNWSEIEHSSEIWRGIQSDILPYMTSGRGEPLLFSDLSDCSRKGGNEIKEALSLLGSFRRNCRVVLSLNQNESEIVAKTFGISYGSDDELFIRDLYRVSNSDIIVIHRIEEAVAFNGSEIVRCPTFLCKDPVVLTGGGDNFNAGFCFAAALGSDLFSTLVVANGVVGFYVAEGRSPSRTDLTGFLENHL